MIVPERVAGWRPIRFVGSGVNVTYEGGEAVIEVLGGVGGISPGDVVTSETSYGLAASAGDATTYSRSNHTHGSPALSDAPPLALGTALPGLATTPARSDHVHPPTGLALSTHNHDAAYAPLVHDHDSRYYTEAESDARFATSGHTHGGGSEAFPVGAIFISAVATSPTVLLGYGVWTAFGAGRVLVGIDPLDTSFDAVEEVGGAKTHTLAETEIPSHTHVQGVNSATTGALSGYTPDTSTNTRVNSGYSTSATGGGGAHNNLQPYIVVYMWKRTA